MKKKILIIFFILFGLLILAVLLIPILFKGKITAMLKSEINKNLEATVDFSSVNLSLIKNFPSLSLTINDLTVTGKDEFEKDTLADVQELTVNINLWTVISGSQITINSVSVSKPLINIIILENGHANYMIVKEDTTVADAEPASFKMKLNEYEITDCWLSYDDRSLAFKMILDQLNHKGTGDFTADFFTLSTNTKAVSSLWYEGIKYFSVINTEIKADMDMDIKNMRFTFKQNELKLNELVFGADGWLSMPDEAITMDLKFEARKNEFANFISLIPGMYSADFKDMKSSGTLALTGFVKGIYSDNSVPGFGVDLTVNNGMFHYPSLPETVKNVTIDLNVINPSGIPDQTEINLRKLQAEIGTSPVEAALTLRTPVSDARFNARLKGKIDFSSLFKIIPLEKGTELSGLLSSDFTASGSMSAIEQKSYENVNSSGTISLTGFRFKNSLMHDAVEVPDCRLSFNPRNITLSNLEMKTAGTDLKANGTIDNLASYFFRDDLLRGSFTVIAAQVDLRPFMSEAPASASPGIPSTVPSAPEIPSNIDFTLNFNADRVLYDNLVLTGFKGNVAVREKTAGLNNITFGLLDGLISMNGLYNGKKVKQPALNFDMTIQKMDIQKTFEHFNSVKFLAPIAGKMTGRYSAEFSIQGNLNEHLEPDYASLSGGGRLQTHRATIANFEPMVKVADALKLDQFKKASLSDANLSFKIIEGRVYIQPYEQSIAGIKVKIEGSSGIDQTIDYTWGLQIPTKTLPSAATGVINSLISKANSTGANLSMGDVVNVNVNIGGTVTKPVIQTGMRDAIDSAAGNLKSKVQQELENKKQDLEDKAKAEAERLKKEAEEKIKAETERLKKEAEEKVKKEAGKKIKDLFGKPK
ncbi:MAG: hypothetical protein IT241_09550 [Bacteroidia bacterium]|nr:hypothetical protein [Bacteroidia bacterium]